MLVFSRRVGEKTVITTSSGERIVVQVSRVLGRNVRMSFDAPSSVRINREDVQKRIDAVVSQPAPVAKEGE